MDNSILGKRQDKMMCKKVGNNIVAYITFYKSHSHYYESILQVNVRDTIREGLEIK
jgi:hypothetical protein